MNSSDLPTIKRAKLENSPWTNSHIDQEETINDKSTSHGNVLANIKTTNVNFVSNDDNFNGNDNDNKITGGNNVDSLETSIPNVTTGIPNDDNPAIDTTAIEHEYVCSTSSLSLNKQQQQQQSLSSSLSYSESSSSSPSSATTTTMTSTTLLESLPHLSIALTISKQLWPWLWETFTARDYSVGVKWAPLLGIDYFQTLSRRVSLNKKLHIYEYVETSVVSSITGSKCASLLFSAFNSNTMAYRVANSGNLHTSSKYAKFKNIEDVHERANAIQKSWSDLGRMASELGTQLHEAIEHYYLSNGEILPDLKSDAYFQQFLKFEQWRIQQNWLPFYCELMIGDLDFTVCGSIDALFVDMSNGGSGGKVIMVDWKRSNKEFNRSATTRRQYGKGPASHFLDTPFNRYMIQQNIYAYILEKQSNLYNIKLDAMYLVQFTEASYIMHKIPRFPTSLTTNIITWCITHTKYETSKLTQADVQINTSDVPVINVNDIICMQ